MSINTSSKLFVGADCTDIKCDRAILDGEYTDDSALNELLDSLPEIIRVSPYYDAEEKHCMYGVEVSCEEILADGGIDHIKALIAQMNDLFKTDKCTLMQSPDVY